MGVLCCGNIVLDVVVRSVEGLRWDTTCWVELIRQTMGGNGANTAYTLAVLGAPVRLLAMVGPDAAGRMLLEKLAAAGVDVRHVSQGRLPTAASVSLVNSRGGRFLLHSPGVSQEAFPEPFQFTPALMEGVSRFHLANPFALPNLRRHGPELLWRALSAGLATSLDTGWDSQGGWMKDLEPALKWVDLLFVNQQESLSLTGSDQPEEAARILARCGVREIVFKLGANGCAVWSRGHLEHIPAFEVEAVDTTGAGDCFAGAFLAALLRDLPLPAAARFANAAAALTVLQSGSTEGLRSWDRIHSWMAGARVRRSG